MYMKKKDFFSGNFIYATYFFSVLLAASTNISAICLTSVHRLVAIKFPIFYRNKITTATMCLIIWVLWFVNIILRIMEFSVGVKIKHDKLCIDTEIFDPFIYRMCLLYSFVLPSCISTVLYIYVFYKVLKRLKKIDSTKSNTENDHCERAQRKMTKVMAVVFIVYYSCYLPVISLVLIPIKNDGKRSISLWCYIIYYINSIINPAIYLWKNKDFRNAAKIFLGVKIKNE